MTKIASPLPSNFSCLFLTVLVVCHDLKSLFFWNEIGQILTVYSKEASLLSDSGVFTSFLKKEEAACAWSFKTDMMWILRVQTCSSGARARVWKYRLWSFKFENTKSIRFSSKSEVHSLISFDMKWWQTYTIRAYFNEINFFKYKLSTWKLHQKWKLYFYIAWQFTHDILYGLVFD